MFEDLEKKLSTMNRVANFYRDQECKNALNAGTSLYYANDKHERMLQEQKTTHYMFYATIGWICLYLAFIGTIGYIVVHFIRKVW